MSKYEPLEAFLRSLDVARYRADFHDLETLLGFKLPKSAFDYPAWWSNDATGHSHARAWLGAGWRTEDLDLRERRVTFRKDEAKPAAAGLASGTSPRDPWGCMAGTVTLAPGADIAAPSGENWTAEAGRPVE